MKAIYPGSFDPITFGHLDIIERSAKIYDELMIVIAINVNKHYLFDVNERLQMIKEATAHLDNVKVVCTEKLIVDFALESQVSIIIRGLRAVSDFESELQFATANYFLNSEIETVFLMSSPQYMFMSSSHAREIAKFHGDVSAFVPSNVEAFLHEKFK